MENEAGAIADAATGTALARAIEPIVGEGSDSPAMRCLNCGTFLLGRHCHRCGQAAHVHRHVGAFGHDLLHSVLHFEGKAWRTLPLLAWHPGELTRRYIEGERAHFVSPLALFLFGVFLTFAVFVWIGIGSASPEVTARDAAGARAEISTVVTNAEMAVLRTRTALAAAERAGRPTGALADQLTREQRALEIARMGESLSNSEAGGIEAALAQLDTGSATLNRAIRHAAENPALTFYKIQTNGYKYSWMLILLSAPFLWLLFPFSRRFGWYDHLVFVTYSISFMTLMLVTLRLLAVIGVPADLLVIIGIVYPPLHVYRQLRGAYRCSRMGALVRAVILVVVAMLALLLFVGALLALAASG